MRVPENLLQMKLGSGPWKDGLLKPKQITEAQIIGVLREVEASAKSETNLAETEHRTP